MWTLPFAPWPFFYTSPENNNLVDETGITDYAPDGYSVALEVDADNRKLFEDFEEKLQSLTGDGELKLIKYDRVYLKIYVNDKGEMAPKFWEVFCEDGKEYKKPVCGEEALLGKYIEGEVVFSIANIFVGKSQSIICVAKEILVREIIEEERSYFVKYPVLRRS